MKRNALVFLLALLLLSVSSATFAADPEFFDGIGDCDGWVAGGKMSFGIQDHMDYNLTVQLFQDGALVYEHYEEGTLYEADGRDYILNGRWGMELCGDYKVVFTFWWFSEYGPGQAKVENPFTCECVPQACTYTPGYWKNHLEAWPVENLTVGCVDYTKAELDRIFDWPTRGNISIKLFHHLVAAKLNVLIGADDYIMGDIMAGDDFFCEFPFHRRGSGGPKREAVRLKKPLADYNEIPCYSDTPDVMLSIEGGTELDKASAATEESSWGSIKKRHQ